MENILVTPVEINYVWENDKKVINTNNAWVKTGDKPPSDYQEHLDKHATKRWIYYFHNASDISTFAFDHIDLEWMRKANEICSITGTFSHMYDDELKETLIKYKIYDKWLKTKRWFARTESVSLKDGEYGVGPYQNLEQVIKSLVTSTRVFKFLSADSNCLRLYFLPFLDDLDRTREFRVFVYKGKIRAISQQNFYESSMWLTELDKMDLLENFVYGKIVTPFNEIIKPKLDKLLPESYTMDFALIGQDFRPYFIEPNSWGHNYAAGSALFGWEQDHDHLHSDDDYIEFRYVTTAAAQEDAS